MHRTRSIEHKSVILLIYLMAKLSINCFCQIDTNDPLSWLQLNMAQAPEGTHIAITELMNSKVHHKGFVKGPSTWEEKDLSKHIFELGSLSKVFTVAVALSLEEEGYLRMTDPIHTYTSYPLASDPGITFAHLANHTSGLPRMPDNFLQSSLRDMSNPYKFYSDSMLYDFLGRHQVDTAQFEKYLYSNLGSGLLAKLLQEISTQSYSELLHKYVFQKLSMSSSSANPSSESASYVTGLNAEGKETPYWEMNALTGASGVFSSPIDLTRFVQAHFTDDFMVFQKMLSPSFQINERMAIGLGWHILYRPDGHLWHWHNGGTGGFTNSMAFSLDEEKAVIMLSNLSALSPSGKKIDELCFSWLETLQ